MTLNMSRLSHTSKQELIDCSEHKCDLSHEYASLANPIGSLYMKLCSRHSMPPDLTITRSLKDRAFNMCIDKIDKRNLPALNKVFKGLVCVDQLRLYSLPFENKSLKRQARRGKSLAEGALSNDPRLTIKISVGVRMHLQANTCLRELMVADLVFSQVAWKFLIRGLEAAKELKVLRLNSCKIDAPTLEKLCPVLSRLNTLRTLDLAGNSLKSPSGYWIGRVISAHNNYRDMEMWSSNLRGSSDTLAQVTGLEELVIADCLVADKVWQEIMQFLTNDSWLNCIDLRNSNLTREALGETVELMNSNHSLMVIDLRGGPHDDLREKVYEMCARNITEVLPGRDVWFDRFKEVLADSVESCYQTQFLMTTKERTPSGDWGTRSVNITKSLSLDMSRSFQSTKYSSTPKTPKTPVRASHSFKRTTNLNTCDCCLTCLKSKADLQLQVQALTSEVNRLRSEKPKLKQPV